MKMRIVWVAGACLALATLCQAQAPSRRSSPPDSQAPSRRSSPPDSQEYNAEQSRQVFEKVCGACHARDFVMPPRSNAQREETIRKMTTLGAKGTPEEFATIVEYLVRRATPASGGGRGVEAGAKDKHIVDDEAADRGRKVWAAECINCHGTQARGNGDGTNLIRSVLVLHDRYASEIGPLLRKGHPMQSERSSAMLTDAEVQDVSHFIHQRVYDTLDRKSVV